MKSTFPFALVVSVAMHGIIIGMASWMPSGTQFDVLQAPNSPEITVLSQPVVTVMEGEISTQEILKEDLATAEFLKGNSTHEVAFNKDIKSSRTKKKYQPVLPSQKQQGAETEAKPLMYANAAPLYPKIAHKRGWEGIVKLDVLVERDGTAKEVGIYKSSGHKVLDRAAIKTVRNWQFSPAQSGSVRFSSRIVIPIKFNLEDE